MNKDAVVTARVETDVKEQAEQILSALGVPVSVVINSLYRQIILRRGIPFAMTLPKAPETVDTLSDRALYEKLKKGYEESVAEEGEPYDQVFDRLEKRYK